MIRFKVTIKCDDEIGPKRSVNGRSESGKHSASVYVDTERSVYWKVNKQYGRNLF